MAFVCSDDMRGFNPLAVQIAEEKKASALVKDSVKRRNLK